jgi:HSP20 family molecular chaperone IbpA
VALGADVDADAAKATYEDGILTVELPIAAPAGTRTVPIRRAGSEP